MDEPARSLKEKATCSELVVVPHSRSDRTNLPSSKAWASQT